MSVRLWAGAVPEPQRSGGGGAPGGGNGKGGDSNSSLPQADRSRRSLPFARAVECLPLGIKAAHRMRPVANRHLAVQVLVNGNRATCQGATKPALVQLPASLPNRHRVVLGYHTLRLDGEDPVQIRPAASPKCRSTLRGNHREFAV